jgi:hypothetical protein
LSLKSDKIIKDYKPKIVNPAPTLALFLTNLQFLITTEFASPSKSSTTPKSLPLNE